MLAEDLRKSVLQSAIQGKLVEQHDSDGNVAQLLDTINAERERLIKEKKIKKTKALEPIADEEIQFDIPDNWKWVRLGDICLQITDGAHKTPKYITEGVPFLSVKNISKGFFDLNDVKYISEEEHQSLIMRCKPERNDLLFCRIGTIGKFKVIDIDLDFSIFVSLGLIKLSRYIYPKFMENVLNSPELYRQYNNIRVDGSHTGKLNLRDIPNLIIPLPPLEEQKRIVAKVEEVMKEIEQYEVAEKELQNLKQSFPVDLKKSLLQAAIQGKLVEQHDSDGNVDELIDSITTERERLIKEKVIKKPKALEPISEEEIPFDIPDNWRWIRLGELGNIVGGGTPKTTIPEYWSESNEGVSWLTPADLSGNEKMFVNHGKRFISTLGLEKSSAQLMPKGSVLFSSRAPIGYTAIAAQPLSTNQGFKSIVPYNMDMSKYLYWVLKAIVPRIVGKANGTTFKEISGQQLAQEIVPLPPIEEQKRIVEKLEQLLPLCDELIE